MYAHRQIYDTTQDVIPVPEQMRHHRIEVIFMVLMKSLLLSIWRSD